MRTVAPATGTSTAAAAPTAFATGTSATGSLGSLPTGTTTGFIFGGGKNFGPSTDPHSQRNSNEVSRNVKSRRFSMSSDRGAFRRLRWQFGGGSPHSTAGRIADANAAAYGRILRTAFSCRFQSNRLTSSRRRRLCDLIQYELSQPPGVQHDEPRPLHHLVSDRLPANEKHERCSSHDAEACRTSFKARRGWLQTEIRFVILPGLLREGRFVSN